MEKTLKPEFYVVARGVWVGNPAKYNSLQSAVEEFASGQAVGRMKKDSICKNAGMPRIVQRLSLKSARLDGTIARIEWCEIPESQDQPYYLLRTYTYRNRGYNFLGYEVTEYSDLRKMMADANKPIENVKNQRSIFTKGLELLAVEGISKKQTK